MSAPITRLSGLSESVQLIDGGTAGLLLLRHLAHACRTIIIYAISFGAPPARSSDSNLPGVDSPPVTAQGVGNSPAPGPKRSYCMRTPACPAVVTKVTAPLLSAVDGLISAIETEPSRWQNTSAGQPEDRWSRTATTEPRHDRDARETAQSPCGW
jgi:hypothetical protein